MSSEPTPHRTFKVFFGLVLKTKMTLGYFFHVNKHAIRKLQMALKDTTRSRTEQAETLRVISAMLDACGVRSVRKGEVEEWLQPNAAYASEVEEQEHEPEELWESEPTWNIERVLATYCEPGTKKRFFLRKWKPTWEPKENLSQKLIAHFRVEQQTIVRTTYFNDEARVDNRCNPQ